MYIFKNIMAVITIIKKTLRLLFFSIFMLMFLWKCNSLMDTVSCNASCVKAQNQHFWKCQTKCYFCLYNKLFKDNFWLNFETSVLNTNYLNYFLNIIFIFKIVYLPSLSPSKKKNPYFFFYTNLYNALWI